MMIGHIEDMAEDKAVLGDSLEAALEQGEKHELFATKCMEVHRIQHSTAHTPTKVYLTSLGPSKFGHNSLIFHPISK